MVDRDNPNYIRSDNALTMLSGTKNLPAVRDRPYFGAAALLKIAAIVLPRNQDMQNLEVAVIVATTAIMSTVPKQRASI